MQVLPAARKVDPTVDERRRNRLAEWAEEVRASEAKGSPLSANSPANPDYDPNAGQSVHSDTYPV